MENNKSFKMEPPIDYFYNSEGKEWTRKHNWVKTEGKTPKEILQEISNELSSHLNWKSNIQLLEQAKLLLFMQFEDGKNTELYADIEDRIKSISVCENYKSPRKIESILNDQIPEAKFNIEYFFRIHH